MDGWMDEAQNTIQASGRILYYLAYVERTPELSRQPVKEEDSSIVYSVPFRFVGDKSSK